MYRWLPLIVFAAMARATWADELSSRNWPAFRGPLATGEAPQAKPPTEWSEHKNIRWKVSLPGRSHATPIIWGDRVYIQTAVKTDKDEGGPGVQDAFGPAPPPKLLFDFQIIALDRRSGRTIWTTTVKEAHPNETIHGYDSLASGTPVTDGENTYAYFGSRGLHCLSPDGKIKWSLDPDRIKPAADFEEGSSTAIYGDTVVINWEHEGKGCLVAIDKRTGKEKWRMSRDEHTSWSTPLIVEADGRPQVIVSATKNIESYDLNTGKEVWRCKGMTESVIPSPMAAGNLLYAISGYQGAACMAIRFAAAHGDISATNAVAWRYDRDTPHVPSALLMSDRLYFLSDTKALITCLDAKTGKKLFGKERLAGIENVYASILGANGHVYVVGHNGTVVVLKDGPEFAAKFTNRLDDEFYASPAAAGKEIFLRGTKSLYCIAE